MYSTPIWPSPLTIDSWRGGRDTDGWKLSTSSACSEFDPWVDVSHSEVEFHESNPSAPETVQPAPCLKGDLIALTELLSPDSPPQCIIRSSSVSSPRYRFGDASGTGLESSLLVSHSLKVTQGVWGHREARASSNFRELSNLVDTLELGLSSSLLKDTKFFLFTDNLTAESVYFNGTSSSKILFDLALCLHKLEMAGDFNFN
jgi:hypothetical protein